MDLDGGEVPDLIKLRGMLSKKTRLIVVHHVSNMLGRRSPCMLYNDSFTCVSVAFNIYKVVICLWLVHSVGEEVLDGFCDN